MSFFNGTSFAYFHGPTHVILFIELNPPTQIYCRAF